MADHRKISLYPALQTYIGGLLGDTNIPEARKELLAGLAGYIKEKKAAGKAVLLNFICTHNSRRSHISQIWAASQST